MKNNRLFFILFFLVSTVEIYGKYIVNPNLHRIDSKNIVVDVKHNLMWQDDYSVKELQLNWNEALQYCQKLNFAGYDDWYLPSKNQLITILDEYEHNPRISTIFKHKKIGFYWSSSLWKNDNSLAWFVYFAYGQTYFYYKDGKYYVRCVRENSMEKSNDEVK